MKKGLIILTALLLLFSLSACAYFELMDFHETTDISQYGIYTKPVYADKDFDPAVYMERFFPDTIEDFFTVQKYSYKYCNTPTIFETYLEIVIDDESMFQEYVASLPANKDAIDFPYKNGFKQIVFSERCDFHHWGSVGYIDMQKIVFSDETNTVVFVVVEAPENDIPFYVNTLNYFTRFDIDVDQYVLAVDPENSHVVEGNCCKQCRERFEKYLEEHKK